MELDLTKRQKEIFDFMRKYAAKTGYPPTVREIGKAVGLHSSSTVHAHLANLEKLGLVRRDPSKPRAIELLFDKAKRTIRPENGLPLVGQVAAGAPILAEENIEEYLEIPDVIGGEDGDYILQIRGESMKDAGILEDDYVIVRPSDDANDGEIVVALIGDEATVKRIFREKDHVRLQPENVEMEPILTTEARVLGKVVGVFRKVKRPPGEPRHSAEPVLRPAPGLDALLVAPLFAPGVRHCQRQQPQRQPGEEVEEAEDRAAPTGDDQDRPRALGQLADLLRHLRGGQQPAGEGTGGVGVVE